MEEKNILFEIKPHFSFVYEMLMPTGRKIRNSIVILVLFIISYFFLTVALNSSDFVNIEYIKESNIDIKNIFNLIAIFFVIIFSIKLIINLVTQIWQYNSIKYTFYEDHLEYEDTFLNQHRKNLRYDNIKEIEIRRTIWDRINGFGIIIIYSNAEKMADNGLIVYCVKKPQEAYERIDKIIHRKKDIPKEVIEPVKQEANIEESEASFKDSLNNKE